MVMPSGGGGGDMEAGELRIMGLSQRTVVISPSITEEQMAAALLDMPPITRALLVGYARLILDADRVNKEIVVR